MATWEVKTNGRIHLLCNDVCEAEPHILILQPSDKNTKSRGELIRRPTYHYLLLAITVIVFGIVSRVIRVGNPIWDKYAGDALYAMLAYLVLSIFWRTGTPVLKAMVTMVIMMLIESFQLTGIPLELRRGSNKVLRSVAILLGTEFRWFDVVAYFVGIASVVTIDGYGLKSNNELGKSTLDD